MLSYRSLWTWFTSSYHFSFAPYMSVRKHTVPNMGFQDGDHALSLYCKSQMAIFTRCLDACSSCPRCTDTTYHAGLVPRSVLYALWLESTPPGPSSVEASQSRRYDGGKPTTWVLVEDVVKVHTARRSYSPTQFLPELCKLPDHRADHIQVSWQNPFREPFP